MANFDCSVSSWEEISDDSRYVYEALARLGFSDFSSLATAEMQLVIALAQHIKRTETFEEWES